MVEFVEAHSLKRVMTTLIGGGLLLIWTTSDEET